MSIQEPAPNSSDTDSSECEMLEWAGGEKIILTSEREGEWIMVDDSIETDRLEWV